MAGTRKGAILVVDDEEIMRDILETLLVREGYDVSVAASGAEGLELARALPFDAALVDIMMPGLDGIATLQLQLHFRLWNLSCHRSSLHPRRAARAWPVLCSPRPALS